MPHEHIVYIPMVALVGFFLGVLATRGASRQFGDEAPGPHAWLPAALYAFLVVVLVFVATHVLPVTGGMTAVSASAGHANLFDQYPSFDASEVDARLEAFGVQGGQNYKVMTFTSDVIRVLGKHRSGA